MNSAGVDRPARQRDEQVVGVARQRGDECLGAVDPGRAQRLVERGVADDRRQGDPLETLTVEVDDHDVATAPVEVVGDGAADPAPAAHDDVAVEVSDLAVHSPPPDVVGEPPLGDQLDAQREGIQHGTDAGDDDGDREHLLGGAELADLAEAHRRDRRDGLVEGVEEREAEQPVPHRADREDRADDPERQAQPGRRRPHDSDPTELGAICIWGCSVSVSETIRAQRRIAPRMGYDETGG